MDLLWICFKQKKVSFLETFIVAEAGIEPARPCGQRIFLPL